MEEIEFERVNVNASVCPDEREYAEGLII